MKQGERLLSIDILRIISISIVIFSHYTFFPAADVGGTTGVVLFFMVSGFCMAYSTEGRTGHGFLLSRAKRLFPEFFICVTISALIEGAWPDIRPDRIQSFRDYVLNVACLPVGNIICDAAMQLKGEKPVEYVMVDGAYWSLIVELRYYILLWFLAYAMRVPWPGIVMGILAVAAGFGTGIPLASRPYDFVQYLSFFAFGMGIRDLRDGRSLGYAVAALATASFLFNSMMGTDADSMPFSNGINPAYAACFIAFPFLIYLLQNRRSGDITVTLGLITYPLYLLHQDVGFIFIETLSKTVPVLPAKIITVLTIAALAYLVNRASKLLVETLIRKKPGEATQSK
jgi:peptidoglycan/LPS O-acetylase OafA/YrhL